LFEAAIFYKFVQFDDFKKTARTIHKEPSAVRKVKFKSVSCVALHDNLNKDDAKLADISLHFFKNEPNPYWRTDLKVISITKVIFQFDFQSP